MSDQTEKLSMTISDIKRELPYVKIKYMGKLYWGKIGGRLKKFPSVYPYIPINRKKELQQLWGQYIFSHGKTFVRRSMMIVRCCQHKVIG